MILKSCITKHCPFSIPNPADAGCSSDLAQYSITPTLRAAGFEDEDDDEDENEAPCEGRMKCRYPLLYSPCERNQPSVFGFNKRT